MHASPHNPRDEDKMVPGTKREKEREKLITTHFPSMSFHSILAFHKSVPCRPFRDL